MSITPEPFVNRVADSGLITLDPASLKSEDPLVFFDLKDCLYMGLLLREKEFRLFVKNHDWASFAGHHVAIGCSTDAIVPVWAFMLLANALQPFAKSCYVGTMAELEKHLYTQTIQALDVEPYRNQRVVIKGCGDVPVPDQAYLMLTSRLAPVAKSIMYGEPCSTVPIMKRKD